ncbi:MAG TPA: flagellar motor protein MotB [Jatrophihabitans sp.]|jgi:chemotaxis protein MotB|uniref:flagellar motor protein MotB n=1 Tax=Jatrophihabitans sp. TaxID=1932789 RepID=UPI002E08992C|nr:flagellar motor protein MotB [Jatrophihabitans sp.]
MSAAASKVGHGAKSATSRGRRSKRGADHGGEEGAERWMVTYADMLTLLLVLFIVLFSISVVNTSKFLELKHSLSSAFGNGETSVLNGGNGLNQNAADGQGQQIVLPGMPAVGPDASTMPQAPTTMQADKRGVAVQQEVEDFTQIKKRINAALRKAGMAGAVNFAIDRRGLIITVVTNALVFPGNSANLLPGGKRIFDVVAPPLVTNRHSIEVDGYTNQVKVNTDPYPTGWELSSARASAVVRYLASAGVSPSRLSAVGFSDQRPLYPASDPRAVALNRRVEIVVLTSLPSEAAALLPAAAAAAR